MKAPVAIDQYPSAPTAARTGAFAWLRAYGLVVLAYVLATLLTGATFQGDAIWYAQQAVAGDFFEAGHLLWRPLGWVVWQIIGPLTALRAGADPAMNVLVSFLAINWVAGLVSVLALHGLLRRLVANEWAVLLATGAFLFAQAFLNYIQTGSSYTTALALLMVGLFLGVRSAGTGGRVSVWALASGAFLALAVCMWMPFVVALPAVALASPLLFGFNRRQLWFAAQIGIACAFTGALVYGLVIWSLGLTDIDAIRRWLFKTSRGNTTGGVARMVFGFARSFINMGQDGVLFKRFVYNDPYNPISVLELVRASLWKFALFYAFLGVIGLSLLRTRPGWRVLGVFLAAAAPALLFAVIWQGGDMERYLALYPFVFLAMAAALASERPLPFTKYVIGAFVAVMVVTNLLVLSNGTLERRQAAAAARLSDLLPVLPPNSVVMALVQQDEVWQLNHSFPFHPTFQERGEFVDELPGSNWRERFSAQTLEVWSGDGEMWLSKRILAERPEPDWNWVEGVDTRRTWVELHTFFAGLQTDGDRGGADGFVRVARSAANQQLFETLAK